jgi:hypothetical protein
VDIFFYILACPHFYYRKGRPGFTDGDVLRIGNGVVIPHYELIIGFEAKTKFLGLDALSYPY